MALLLEKLNLFNREIKYQFLIIGLWLIGLILVVYTLVYQSIIPDLISAGILPSNQIFVLIIGLSLCLIGIILLLVIPKQSIYLSPTDSAN
jgi:uncharacterized membrane protein